ncbi:MAG: MGH1-like glycoside hydrolase domain-containing protein, partial [Planctomycetota bacterium]
EVFWLRNEGAIPRRYSFWAADAYYARYLVQRNKKHIVELLDDLIGNYKGWEKERLLGDGLFWQYDVLDGMEESVSGSRRHKKARPTINSYMYGDARAISRIGEMAGRGNLAKKYAGKAAQLKKLVQDSLWDKKAKFFKVRHENGKLSDAREAIGYVPWYFNLPDGGYEEAWKQLMDPEGFYAPFGPTTAEQRHPGFVIAYIGDDCQWNGPSWPYSTSQILVALANLLNNYKQDLITKADYFETLKIYTKSHRLRLDDGRVVPWIDENLDPYTGQWLARLRKLDSPNVNTSKRGKDYNHSSYCDLIISGLIGIRPRPDDIVEVNPLVPKDTLGWFCLDNVPYHGRIVTILWDKNGTRYGKGKGLRVYADGKQIAYSDALERITGSASK